MLTKDPFMLELLKQLLNSKKKTTGNPAAFKEQFFSEPSHQWITQNISLRRAFELFLEHCWSYLLEYYGKMEKILFIHASGKLACTVNCQQNNHAIIIFPDLERLLKS